MALIHRYRKTLCELFAQVQELHANPENTRLCASIQEALIAKLTYIETRIRTLKRARRATKRELGTKREERLSATAAAQMKASVRRQAQLLEEYAELSYVLRTVGDAIAFTYMNKWDIKPLAFHPPPGFISGKSGSRGERRLARMVWQSGNVAILNDLTNSVRLGDLTIPRNGQFMLMELKSSDAGGQRVERQRQRLDKIGSYLRTDTTEGLYGREGMWVRSELGSEEVHHRERLNALIAQARRDKAAYAEVEPGLYYLAATEGGHFTDFVDTIAESQTEGAIAAFVNSGKFTPAAYYPFTLSIDDPSECFAFWAGELVLSIVVDVAVMKRAFRSRNHTVSLDMGSEFPLALHALGGENSGEMVCKVSDHFFGRIFNEFLSLDWLVSEMVRHPERSSAAEALLAERASGAHGGPSHAANDVT